MNFSSFAGCKGKNSFLIYQNFLKLFFEKIFNPFF